MTGPWVPRKSSFFFPRFNFFVSQNNLKHLPKETLNFKLEAQRSVSHSHKSLEGQWHIGILHKVEHKVASISSIIKLISKEYAYISSSWYYFNSAMYLDCLEEY